MRALPATILVAALGAATLARPEPAAAARPEVVAEVGGTAVVQGDPGQGGASLAVAVLWPIEKRFRFGLMGSLDDFGTLEARLVSPGGVDLGPIGDLHRASQSAVWRIEGHLREARGWRAFGAGTWGLHRVADDLLGDQLSRVIAVGGGLGLGVLRSVSGPHAVGVLVRYQMLSRGSPTRYLSAAAEWRWGSEAPE